jgi:hypothetical protein
MKKLSLLSSIFSIALMLSGCSTLNTAFESSTGSIGHSVDDNFLINGIIQRTRINSRNVTTETPLQGSLDIENSSQKKVSGKLLFEITTLGAYQPVWVANLDVSLAPNEKRNIPFIFYFEDIIGSLNLEEVKAERELSSTSDNKNLFDLDLVVRSQINEVRDSFSLFLGNQ